MFKLRVVAVVLIAMVAGVSADAAMRCGSNIKKPDRLAECVTLDNVRQHQAALQAIADGNGGTRVVGSSGDAASFDYVADELEDAGYDVRIQPFSFMSWHLLGSSTLEQTSPGTVTYIENTDYAPMDQCDPGDVSSTVTAVDLNLATPAETTSGCEMSDFAGFTAGHIALIQRGGCTFRQMAENAAAAGAVGAVIMNQGGGDTGLFSGTLGPDNTAGIPVVSTTFGRGMEWAGTPGLAMRLIANVVRGTVTTSNLIAETDGGRGHNVVMAGAHLDSVPAGPGIQDNGSGSAALLEIALQMRNVNPSNKVRFAWWGAEESGLLGSQEYVGSLSTAELDDIALYLNFDMIGSPNFARFVYDSSFASTPGSAAIEQAFADYYTALGLPFELNNTMLLRSDAEPFDAVGIPAGGLFTGAEGIKSDAQVALYGGTAGEQYDPCYHLACDTFANISLEALDENADAAAFVIMGFAKSTRAVNGRPGSGRPVLPIDPIAALPIE